MSCTAVFVCATFSCFAQDADLSGLKSFRDVPYVTGGGERQQLDVFVPEDANQPLPVIVWIHGGSWRSGSKNQCIPLMVGFHKKGYVIASINYRFVTTDPFPAQIEDCKAAIRFLRANAEKYHIDPNRIAAWGASAGGHLAALLGVNNDELKVFDVGENLDQSSNIQAVCNTFGPMDFNVMLAVGRRNEGFYGGPVEEKMDLIRKASPALLINNNTAPFLHVHGDKDTVVPLVQSEMMHDALTKAGIYSELIVVKDGEHDSNVLNDTRIIPATDEFLKRTLK